MTLRIVRSSHLILVMIPLLGSSSIGLADSDFQCDQAFKQQYIVAGKDQTTPLYRFTRLRDDFLFEMESRTNPEKIECLSDYYEKAMSEVGTYWSRRVKTQTCASSCKKEFQRSTAFLTSLDHEFKRKVKSSLFANVRSKVSTNEDCDSEKRSALALQPLTDIKKLNDELCCGKENGPATGVVYGIYPDISQKKCLEKVHPSPYDSLSTEAITHCTNELTMNALDRLFENIQGLATLPFELWAARDQIWEIMTHPELREAFAQNVAKKLQTFVSQRIELVSTCLNPFEKSNYICALTGDLIGNLVTPATIGKLFKLAQGSVQASKGVMESVLPKLDAARPLQKAQALFDQELAKIRSSAQELQSNALQVKQSLSESLTKKLEAFAMRKSAFLEALDQSSKNLLKSPTEKTKLIQGEANPPEPKIPESPARDYLISQNLLPQYHFPIKDGTVNVSRPFTDDGGRKFFVVEVNSGGTTETMTFYRSHSSGVFRKLPSYHRSGWYDKGFSEDALTATPEMQEILNSAALNELNGPVVSDISKLEGVIRVFDHPDDQHYMSFKTSMQNSYQGHGILNPNQKKFQDGVGRTFAEPKDITIADTANAPDYSSPVRSYTFENRTYGKVNAEVYRSSNGKVEYTLMRDQTGKVWFGDIGLTGTVLKSGLRGEFIQTEELTAPLWEYPQQIAVPYKTGVRKGSYESNWNYIREIPEIQRYYREKGLEIPKD